MQDNLNGYHATTMQLVGPTTFYGLGIQELGTAVIRDSFRWASVAFLNQDTGGRYNTLSKPRLVEQCVAFVEGSSLDIALNLFGFQNIDPSDLRDTFHRKCKSQSSSVITPEG